MLVCHKAMVASLYAWKELLVHNLKFLIHVQLSCNFEFVPSYIGHLAFSVMGSLKNGFGSYRISTNVSIRVPIVCRRGV